MEWHAVIDPTLIVDIEKCKRNIYRMIEKAQKNEVLFRPHFKTHQSQDIGALFRSAGVRRITTSSFRMAQYFARDGWNDITVAFPVNVRDIRRIRELAGRIHLNIVLEDAATAYQVGKLLNAKVGVFIKIDVGSGRTGIAPDQFDQLDKLVNMIQGQEMLKLNGFMAHAGHSYQARTVEEMAQIHKDTTEILSNLRMHFKNHFSNLILSVGDTPTCSMLDDLSGVDEIRPGNFIFYDLMQTQIGSCNLEDVAVILCCPVVAKHPHRKEIILHGGGIHFSRDFLQIAGGRTYGQYVELESRGWRIPNDATHIRSLSQEHGIVKCTDAIFERYKPGDLMGFLPVHSCMTADCMGSYRTLNGQPVDHMQAHCFERSHRPFQADALAG